MTRAWLAAALCIACGGSGGTGTDSAGAVADGPRPSPADASPGAPDALVCTAPVMDCNDDPADGCETNTDTDPTDCGSCGHDCLGGTCIAGRCQPVMMIDGLSNFSGFAQDGEYLYFSKRGTSSSNYTDGSINRVAKNGGSPSAIVMNEENARSVIHHDGALFWTRLAMVTGPAVRFTSTSGPATPVTLATGTTPISHVAADSGHVYWVELGGFAIDCVDGLVRRVVRGGGASETLHTDVTCPVQIGVTDDTLYWSSSLYGPANGLEGLWRSPKDGGAAEQLVTIGHIMALVTDANSAWAVKTGTNSGGFENGIIYHAVDGAPIATVAMNRPDPDDIAIHAGRVFWIEYGLSTDPSRGAIIEHDPATGETTTFWDDVEYGTRILVDDAAVYWVTTESSSSEIWKIAR